MKKRKLYGIFLSAVFFCAGSVVYGQDKAVSYESLLQEMVNRDVIARFPSPEYVSRQFSSYDRRMKVPDQSDWFANEDWCHFVGVEEKADRKEWVMMDSDGPGCIVRIWCAGLEISGRLRVYIDGADEPVIEGNVVDLIGGRALVGEPLSAVRARGRSLYLPIPYAEHCRVTYDGPNFWHSRDYMDTFYYQINYRTYQAGTSVRSFSIDSFNAGKEVMQQSRQLLLTPWKTAEEKPVSSHAVAIDGTDSSASTAIAGPGAIYRMSLKLESGDIEQATRSVVLVMEFDGEKAVWAPVGEFFGSGIGVNPYRCWWRMAAKDGTMTCYWPMPFAKSCKISLLNLGQEPVKAKLVADRKNWNWDDRSMYFHAGWRYKYPVDSQPHFDWNFIEVKGRGVMVGDTLALLNGNADWWGEGDEKIYIDGEGFPSHVGTGTENYYGYACGTPEFFEGPFHAQPRADGPRNFGRVTNTRSRSLDAVPFRKSLRFDMELWHWTETQMAYATTTYWYAMPGAVCNIVPAPELAAKKIAHVSVPWKTVEGAIEGETLKILDKTAGIAEAQSISQFNWSGGRQMWWRDGKVGAKLVLEFPVGLKGRYDFKVNLTKANDYGIVQLYLDGKKVAEPIDLYSSSVAITEAISVGTYSLDEGRHQLTAEIVGANAKSVKRYMFGLDYVMLDQVK